MSKFTRKISVLFLATIIALGITGCKNKEELEKKEAMTVEKESEGEAKGEEKEGSLVKVLPKDDGTADMIFKDEDGEETTVVLKNKGELYKFTILHKYSYSYNSKNEIIDFDLLEAYDPEG